MAVEKPTKDDVIKDLIEFFFEEFNNDPKGVGDWLVQGDWTPEDFIEATKKLQRELSLRD